MARLAIPTPVTTPLVYGAYGYTGELIAREAVDAGIEPVLAGRRERPLVRLAEDLGLAYRVADLGELADVLHDVDLLLHCAGPFRNTYESAVEACLATGTHYVDITGEIEVFEAIRALDERATEAGVMLLPGCGFDIVPSDCLGATLHERLPGADRLTLAFPGLDEPSPGTARTAAGLMGDGVPVREDGELRHVRFGSRTRTIDVGTGRGPQRMAIFPWGDVSTAHHTTGIPNIEVYCPGVMGLGPGGQRLVGTLQPLLGLAPVRAGLITIADAVSEGPDEAERQTGSTFFWGEVTDGERRVTGRVHTPETYRFTAAAVMEIAGRVLEGHAPAGYQTPASAYGPELVASIDGTRFAGIEETPAR